MKVAVVLGNRINDDDSLTSVMIHRLELAKKYYDNYHPDFIIVSGGLANEKVNFSESKAMRKWLVASGIDEKRIIEEGNSLTTLENAKYSIPICKALGADSITVITTFDHFLYSYIHVVEYFGDYLNDDSIELMFYTSSERK